MPFDKLEEFFLKIAAKTNTEATNKATVEAAQTATNNALTASTIVEQVASFIEELKDFIDDRLVDTTCQLELSNQRIGDLHMSLNFLIGEITYLKYQNQELKNDMNSFLQNLKKESSNAKSSGNCLASNSQICKCSKSKTKKKNKSTDTSSVSNSTTNTNASTSSADLKINTNTSTANNHTNRSSVIFNLNNHTNTNNVTSRDGSRNRPRKPLIDSNGVSKTTNACINTCGDENYGSTIMCSVVDDNDYVDHKKYIVPISNNLERFHNEKNSDNSGQQKQAESFGENLFDSQYKLEWPTNNFQQKSASPLSDMNGNVLNSKLEADILYIKNLMSNHQKSGKIVTYMSTELSDSSSDRSSNNKNKKGFQNGTKTRRMTNGRVNIPTQSTARENYGDQENEDEEVEEYEQEKENSDSSSSVENSSPGTIKKYSNSRANSN
jgi:hypothetical protein